MNTERPILSILMGVYYRRDDITLLERSVSSILNQTFSSFELLICDDGSLPTAAAYLDALSIREPRLRLIRQGSLLTLPSKLNACLAEAQGHWIARMDDDDFSHPERFAKQVEYLQKNTQIAFVGCNVNLWRDGIVVGKRVLPEYPTVRDFYFVQPYIHPALLFRKEVLLKVAGYSEERSCILCEDYDLLLRLYAAGYKGANLQEYLLDYTIPATAKGDRKMCHRWNEVITRFRRFKELGCLSSAWPYILKPMIVGLLPESVLQKLKNRPINV